MDERLHSVPHNASCKCGFKGVVRITEPCSKFQQAQTDENWNESDCIECGHWRACHAQSSVSASENTNDR